MKRTLILALALFIFPPPMKGQEPGPALDAVRKLAEAAWQTQDWPNASKHYAELVKLEPKNGLAWHHLGYALHAQGQLDEALAAHEQAAKIPGLTQNIGFYNAACVHALKGRKDDAFASLEKAIGVGFADEETAVGDTDLESLRSDPRWEKSLAAIRAAKGKGGGIRPPFVQSPPRHTSRMAYFGRAVHALFINYGPVAWKDEYQKQAESQALVGKRWRLGSDFWTTLDTNVAVTIGATRFEPNAYYLTLEKNAEGQVLLTVLDSADVRKQKLDAFQSAQTKGGISVPLTAVKDAPAASELTISLASDPANPATGKITIAFGPHTFEAPLQVHF